MAQWNAEIANADFPNEMGPGDSGSAVVDVSVDVPPYWSAANTDSCSPSLLSIGVDTLAVVYIDGVQVDGRTKCIKRDSDDTFTLDLEAPSTPGSYSIRFEVKGANTGEVEAVHTGSIRVPEPTDPTYNLDISAPGSVDARENFEVRGYASCSDGNCPQKDWRIIVAGETVKSGTVDLSAGAEVIKSAGPDGLFINDPGTKDIVFEVGSKSASQTISVNEVDPPYEPLPGDGGGNGGSGGGNGSQNIPWGAVALAGGLALSSRDDGGSPDSVTEDSNG